MEMPLTVRNVVRLNALFTCVGFYVLKVFAGSKKKGLPRILRLVVLAKLP